MIPATCEVDITIEEYEVMPIDAIQVMKGVLPSLLTSVVSIEMSGSCKFSVPAAAIKNRLLKAAYCGTIASVK